MPQMTIRLPPNEMVVAFGRRTAVAAVEYDPGQFDPGRTFENAPRLPNNERKKVMKPLLPALMAAVLAAGAVSNAHASDDPWVLRFGAHVVNPKSDNGQLAGMKASIASDTRPTVSLEYLITPSWGVELLAAVPFKHDIRLDGTTAASTRQLPPTLGVNYHFMPDAKVSPFVGAGLNYTYFFSTKGQGPLQGTRVKIDNSWGAAAHAGIDVQLSPQWLLTADVRWISISGDVHVNGTKVGTAKVDPLVYGLSFGYRF
ncbi:OmpW family protein [Rhodanobacter ginsengisoli]|uniref:OmpW family protein n=1 Tax=Rhodanobacter ginsengisoli TaxID=418646 RepID=A0ABW0QQB5_9GAMM